MTNDPAPQHAEFLERRRRLLGPAYRLFYDDPVYLVRGNGVWLYDEKDNAYLDAYNNVVPAGHCHPAIQAAISTQAARLNTHTRYLSEGILRYAEALLAHFPGLSGHVMFTCSGSEANDLALQLARSYTGGMGLVVTSNAYHGNTTAVSAISPSIRPPTEAHVRTIMLPTDGDLPTRRRLFGEYTRTAVADLRAHGMELAALILDSAFSSDGVFVDPPGFINDAVDVVRKAGGIFIADEVQAGFGRLGAMWGFERHEIVPDIVTLGKPMGNGHPVAAVVASKPIVEAFARQSRYFNTFGGNPVSCAAGMAVLEVLQQEGFTENVASTGSYLKHGLENLAAHHSCIGEVRGAGLYYGVEILGEAKDSGGHIASQIVNTMRARRVLVGTTGPEGDVLKIRPPLVFSRRNADHLLDVIDSSIRTVRS